MTSDSAELLVSGSISDGLAPECLRSAPMISMQFCAAASFSCTSSRRYNAQIRGVLPEASGLTERFISALLSYLGVPAAEAQSRGLQHSLAQYLGACCSMPYANACRPHLRRVCVGLRF